MDDPMQQLGFKKTLESKREVVFERWDIDKRTVILISRVTPGVIFQKWTYDGQRIVDDTPTSPVVLQALIDEMKGLDMF